MPGFAKRSSYTAQPVAYQEPSQPEPSDTPPQVKGLATELKPGVFRITQGPSNLPAYASVISFVLPSVNTNGECTVEFDSGKKLSPIKLQTGAVGKSWSANYTQWRTKLSDGSVLVTLAFPEPVTGSLSVGGQHFRIDTHTAASDSGAADGSELQLPKGRRITRAEAREQLAQGKVPDRIVFPNPPAVGPKTRSSDEELQRAKADLKQLAEEKLRLERDREKLAEELEQLKKTAALQARTTALTSALFETKNVTAVSLEHGWYYFQQTAVHEAHTKTGSVYHPWVRCRVDRQTGEFRWSLRTYGKETDGFVASITGPDHPGGMLEWNEEQRLNGIRLTGRFRNSAGKTIEGEFTLGQIKTFLGDELYKFHIGCQIERLQETYTIFRRSAPQMPGVSDSVAPPANDNVRDPKPVDKAPDPKPVVTNDLSQEVVIAGLRREFLHTVVSAGMLSDDIRHKRSVRARSGRRPPEPIKPRDRWFNERTTVENVDSLLQVRANPDGSGIDWVLIVGDLRAVEHAGTSFQTGLQDWRTRQIGVRLKVDEKPITTTIQDLQKSHPEFYARLIAPHEKTLDALAAAEVAARAKPAGAGDQAQRLRTLEIETQFYEQVTYSLEAENPALRITRSKTPENGWYFAVPGAQDYSYCYVRINPKQPGHIQWSPHHGDTFTDYTMPDRSKWFDLHDWRLKAVGIKPAGSSEELTITQLREKHRPLYDKFFAPFAGALDGFDIAASPEAIPFYYDWLLPNLRAGYVQKSNVEHSVYSYQRGPENKGIFYIYFRANPENPAELQWQLLTDSFQPFELADGERRWRPIKNWENERVIFTVDGKRIETTLPQMETASPAIFEQYFKDKLSYLRSLAEIQARQSPAPK